MSRRALSRQAQAFQSLLEEDSDEDDFRSKGKKSSSKSNRKSNSKKSGNTSVPGFKLREEESRSVMSNTSDQSKTADLDHLLQLFGESLPRDIISDIYLACNSSKEAALNALLDMTSNTTDHTSIMSQQQSPSNALCYWDSLPTECKLLILDSLSLHDLARIAATCREISSHVRSQRQSLTTITIPAGISWRGVRGFVSAFPSAHAIDLTPWSNTLRFPHDVEDLSNALYLGESDRRSGIPITTITIKRAHHLTNSDIFILCDALHSLRKIQLHNCISIGDEALHTLSKYSRSNTNTSNNNDSNDDDEYDDSSSSIVVQHAMHALDIHEQSPPPPSTTNDNNTLYTVEMPRQAVDRIVATINTTNTTTNTNTTTIMNNGIEEIVLTGSDHITSKGVSSLLKGSSRAPSLLHLDVSRCPRITGDALVPGPRSTLRTLRANGCNALRSLIMHLPSNTNTTNTNGLQELYLSSCPQLTEVSIIAPSLRYLNLSNCAQLSSLSLRCPHLTTLHLSGCSNLRIDPGMTGGAFHCPNIETLNLFGCRSLDSSSFEAILPSLCNIKDLDLTGCISLGRVVAARGDYLGKLCRLMMDGCSVMRVVSVSSTVLSEVSAKGCRRLVELNLVDSCPKTLDLENCVELRQVALGGSGGNNSSSYHHDQHDQQDGKRNSNTGMKLVLKGCNALPDAVRKHLSEMF